MARCWDLIFCGSFVLVALSLQGCEDVPECAEKCGEYSTKAGSVDATSENVCLQSSKKTGGLSMCIATHSAHKCPVGHTECKQTMDADKKAQEGAVISAATTPKCGTVCTSYKDSMTLESPAVCMVDGVCGATEGCARRLQEATTATAATPTAATPTAATPTTATAATPTAATPTEVKEETTAAVATAKDAQEVITDKPGGGVLCKPIVPVGTKTATKTATEATKTTAVTTFLAGVLPEAVVIPFANMSMALIAVGLTLMAAMGVAMVLRRRPQASDSDSEASSEDIE